MALTVGIGIGVALGLLLASRSGQETRERLLLAAVETAELVGNESVRPSADADAVEAIDLESCRDDHRVF